MEALIWIGAGLTLVGLAGLVWCIVVVLRARKAGLSDEELKSRLQSVVALNMGALAVSGIGLMCVVVGILLA